MTKNSPGLRRRMMSTMLAGACGCLWGCAARSGMLDEPEDELPAGTSTGGVRSTSGAAGTSAAMGGSPWASGGAGGIRTTGGAGGRPATGGMGGGPATGGTGGGFIGSCEYPSCLWDLIGDCQVAGPCTEDDSGLTGDLAESIEICCSNGVNERITFRAQGSGFTGTLAVTKNGNRCYDVSFATRADGNTVDYAWLEPSGQAVAKASFAMTDSSFPVIYCANGESMLMTDECAPDGSQAAEISTGTCP
jgi:hypothetical protein